MDISDCMISTEIVRTTENQCFGDRCVNVYFRVDHKTTGHLGSCLMALFDRYSSFALNMATGLTA